VHGGKRAEFGFEGLGTLGSLGHGAAVAQIFGINVSGLLAWFLWRYIYLMKMPGLNRKVRIAADWLLHLLFPPELAQTKVASESGRNARSAPGVASAIRAMAASAFTLSRQASSAPAPRNASMRETSGPMPVFVPFGGCVSGHT
jgi:hypothetical protein